jgi:hypothetical protein
MNKSEEPKTAHSKAIIFEFKTLENIDLVFNKINNLLIDDLKVFIQLIIYLFFYKKSNYYKSK